jgi:hypothetical protein
MSDGILSPIPPTPEPGTGVKRPSSPSESVTDIERTKTLSKFRWLKPEPTATLTVANIERLQAIIEKALLPMTLPVQERVIKEHMEWHESNPNASCCVMSRDKDTGIFIAKYDADEHVPDVSEHGGCLHHYLGQVCADLEMDKDDSSNWLCRALVDCLPKGYHDAVRKYEDSNK